MESAFKLLVSSRNIYLGFLGKYSLEQLNTIPQGFSNNLIWNIGHIIAVQQRLFYSTANLPMNISTELFERYKGGTKPSVTTTQAEVDELKGLLISLVEKSIVDFNAGEFVSFTETTTGSGFHLSSTEDAINFNNYHEAIHLGFMMNIRKFI